MRNLIDMDTIQIEITNHCTKQCSNCTRFVGHHQKPYFMDFDYFKRAIDSMVGYPKMVGFQGGEPLLHPDFKKMCEYALLKIPKKQLGLWTTLPKGFEHYREIIVETFEHILINDHTRPDIFHCPALVGVEEVVPVKEKMFYLIDRCWVQNSWSASINPHGAFFCEMAASFSMLYPQEKSCAWEVERGWWWRTPKDFKEQIERWCPMCGFPCSLQRRSSIEEIDDISPKHFLKLKDTSPKIKSEKYIIHDLSMVDENKLEKLAAYKDNTYRNNIAKRYGMFLTINEQKYWKPHLLNDCYVEETEPRKSYLEFLREKYK